MTIELGDNREWFGAQASLKFFMVKFLGLQWFDHYDDWYDIVRQEKRSDVQSPRGHGKSTFWSFGVPQWDVIRGKANDLLVSYSEDQVRRLIRNVKVEIEMNKYLAPIRPSTKEIWGTDMLTFSDGGIIQGLGFGTSARGLHPKRIIGDDVLKDMGGMSSEDQERAWFGIITGMAMADTQIHVIGTPVDFEDLLMKLESNQAYKHWKKPALGPTGLPLCPQLFSKETLDMRRIEMGSLNFAREYLLQRIDPATQPFKRQYETFYTEVPARFARKVTVCDPAYSEGDGDYSAIVTVGFTGGNHAYVLEAKAIRREDPGAIVKELIRTIRTQVPDSVGIEQKKGQAIEYSFREERTRLNLWDFKYVELMHHGKGKDDQTRVGGLVPRWESRSVHIHPEMNLLRAQLYAYRLHDRSKQHDDLVDALAYCFHPDLISPNSGKSNMPLDEESASMEGKPRYQIGQGETWVPTQAYQWMSGRESYGRSLAGRLDTRNHE